MQFQLKRKSLLHRQNSLLTQYVLLLLEFLALAARQACIPTYIDLTIQYKSSQAIHLFKLRSTLGSAAPDCLSSWTLPAEPVRTPAGTELKNSQAII